MGVDLQKVGIVLLLGVLTLEGQSLKRQAELKNQLNQALENLSRMMTTSLGNVQTAIQEQTAFPS